MDCLTSARWLRSGSQAGFRMKNRTYFQFLLPIPLKFKIYHIKETVKMPWQALVWLLGFILQSGILGVSMYQLVQVTDLEADFVNPHDASKSYNRLVVGTIILNISTVCMQQNGPFSA